MHADSKGLVVVDTETLGIWSDSVVLSIGLCYAPWEARTVEQLKASSINLVLDIEEQKHAGRKIDPNTVAWWQKQSSEAINAWAGKDVEKIKMSDVKPRIDEFMQQHTGKSWYHSDVDNFERRAFDFHKLAHMHEVNLGQNKPWSYVHEYDLPSVLVAWGFDRYGDLKRNDYPDLTYHNSRWDAVFDAFALLNAADQKGFL